MVPLRQAQRKPLKPKLRVRKRVGDHAFSFLSSWSATKSHHEIAAWEDDRNANHAKADWQFTTAGARIKLKHLYPSI
jgi:hypothetical protein